ncbi:hypothetical protein D3C86_1517790 [compost metagenome]
MVHGRRQRRRLRNVERHHLAEFGCDGLQTAAHFLGKGEKESIAQHAEIAHQGGDLDGIAIFQLDINAAAAAQMAEVGIKTRHHSALEVFPEPAARIQRIDLARQGMADRPRTVGRALKRFVVKDIQHAIRALAHIKLDIIRTLL